MAELLAGAACVVITPTVSEWDWSEVADDLHARALVLQSEQTKIAIVTCDLVVVRAEEVDEAKSKIEELTGIPRGNIVVAATHTHYAPASGGWREGDPAAGFSDWLVGRVVDAVVLANSRLRPARVAYGSGAVPGEVFNRRYWMTDGKVWFNPLDCRYRNENDETVYLWKREDIVKPAGPTDPELGVLVVVGEDWEPIAVVGNYAVHYVNDPNYDKVSANYFGQFEVALQRMAGSEFVAIMLNGTCGDINNEDYMGTVHDFRDYPYESYQVERVADVVAAEAYGVWRSLDLSEFRASVPVAVASERVALKVRPVSEQEVAEAKELLETPAPSCFGDPQWLSRVRARSTVRCSEIGPQLPVLVQAFRVGDVGLAALPGEIFVEYGLQIKQQSPLGLTMVAELANDSIGYVPTDRAFAEGSYEVLNSRFTPGTEGAIVDAAVRLLEDVAADGS